MSRDYIFDDVTAGWLSRLWG